MRVCARPTTAERQPATLAHLCCKVGQRAGRKGAVQRSVPPAMGRHVQLKPPSTGLAVHPGITVGTGSSPILVGTIEGEAESEHAAGTGCIIAGITLQPIVGQDSAQPGVCRLS